MNETGLVFEPDEIAAAERIASILDQAKHEPEQKEYWMGKEENTEEQHQETEQPGVDERKDGICACCGTPGKIKARGLIRRCYERHRANGTLQQFELYAPERVTRGTSGPTRHEEGIVNLDFNDHRWVLRQVAERAKKNFRSVNMQILFELSQTKGE